MKHEEYLDYLRQKDKDTLENRALRRRQLKSISFTGTLPKLLWEYYTEAVQLYIDGYFLSVLLWCESILEIILMDKLRSCGKTENKSIESANLAAKASLSYTQQLITRQQHSAITNLRKLRNAISHANADKLSSISQKCYKNLDEAITANLYLANTGNVLQNDALRYLGFIRELANTWYGNK